MTPHEFELAVANDFRDQGFEVTHVGKSFDKGVDFIAENDEDRIAVQVKMYETRIVRYQEFMYLYAGQELYDCNKAILITTKKIDAQAKSVAIKLGVDYFEDYILTQRDKISRKPKQNLRKSESEDFFGIWQRYIKPLKGTIIYTAKRNERNLIVDVTNDYLSRISSKNKISKIEYEIFETIYHRLLETKEITREQINTEYVKRASAIITVVLARIPNVEIVQQPKIGLRLNEKIAL